jgi:hypothetical protein
MDSIPTCFNDEKVCTKSYFRLNCFSKSQCVKLKLFESRHEFSNRSSEEVSERFKISNMVSFKIPKDSSSLRFVSFPTFTAQEARRTGNNVNVGLPMVQHINNPYCHSSCVSSGAKLSKLRGIHTPGSVLVEWVCVV